MTSTTSTFTPIPPVPACRRAPGGGHAGIALRAQPRHPRVDRRFLLRRHRAGVLLELAHAPPPSGDRARRSSSPSAGARAPSAARSDRTRPTAAESRRRRRANPFFANASPRPAGSTTATGTSPRLTDCSAAVAIERGPDAVASAVVRTRSAFSFSKPGDEPPAELGAILIHDARHRCGRLGVTLPAEHAWRKSRRTRSAAGT